MKPYSNLLTIAGTIVVLTRIALAQPWQTIDDFQYVLGKSSVALGVTVDPYGNVFAAGHCLGLDTYHGLVQKSRDGGLNWTLSDDFATGTQGGTFVYDAASDYLGNIYYVGYQADAVMGPTWYVRQGVPNPDGSMSWNTVDRLGYGGHARAVSTDSAGNVYVAGYASLSNTTTWIVRKGANFGTTWSTIDSFSPNGYGYAYGVFFHPTAGVFAIGSSASGKNASQVWTTRRSVDGGASWTTVDAYSGSYLGWALGGDAFGNVCAAGVGAIRKSANGGTSWTTTDNFSYCVTATSTRPPYKTTTTCYGGTANGLGMDSNGNLYAVGYTDTGSGMSWFVKKNAGGTSGWTTSDAFQPAVGKSSDAYKIAPDAAGHVYVAGWANDTSGVGHWIVRKLSP